MAGPGIRAWELARALAAENDVSLLAGEVNGAAAGPVHCAQATRSRVSEAVAAADVVIVQASAIDLLPLAELGNRALVVDLYDPQVIEDLEIHREAPMAERLRLHSRAVADLAALAARGDLFLCASERQRLLLLGELAARGRLNPLTYEDDSSLGRLVAIVPFGLPATPPVPGNALRGALPGVGPGDRVIVWGGGLWNWFDPVTLVRAAAELAPAHADLRVVFMGAGHPNLSVPRMRVAEEARRAAAELGLEGRTVFFAERWLPYAERGAFLAEADVAVSLHRPGIETLLAFRTRVLDYLWAGLPCVLTEGDVMAELAVKEGFGLACPAGDAGAVAAAIGRLLAEPELAARCGASARRVADGFRWEVVVQPLADFCRAPRRSADASLVQSAGRASANRFGGVAHAWTVLRSEGPRRFAARAVRRLRRVTR